MTDWRKVQCPECKRKGLHYAPHPHALGWKNYDIVTCRFCKKRYDTRNFEAWLAQQYRQITEGN